jgi:hypothetical protein
MGFAAPGGGENGPDQRQSKGQRPSTAHGAAAQPRTLVQEMRSARELAKKYQADWAKMQVLSLISNPIQFKQALSSLTLPTCRLDVDAWQMLNLCTRKYTSMLSQRGHAPHQEKVKALERKKQELEEKVRENEG